MNRIRIELTPFLGIGVGVGSNLGNKIFIILIPFISIEITI
tara:strand:- start:277 stop:399 length:123 start_codon:yes stop_codon:yes gene_type:complete